MNDSDELRQERLKKIPEDKYEAFIYARKKRNEIQLKSNLKNSRSRDILLIKNNRVVMDIIISNIKKKHPDITNKEFQDIILYDDLSKYISLDKESYMFKLKKDNFYLYQVFKNMCDIIGVYESAIYSCDKWRRNYSWTEKEMKSFRYWFRRHLLQNDLARKRLMPVSHEKDNKKVYAFVDYFIKNYGWKLKT